MADTVQCNGSANCQATSHRYDCLSQGVQPR
jgi:hypothetical protein